MGFEDGDVSFGVLLVVFFVKVIVIGVVNDDWECVESIDIYDSIVDSYVDDDLVSEDIVMFILWRFVYDILRSLFMIKIKGWEGWSCYVDLNDLEGRNREDGEFLCVDEIEISDEE